MAIARFDDGIASCMRRAHPAVSPGRDMMTEGELNDCDCLVPDVSENDFWVDPRCLHEGRPRVLPPRRPSMAADGGSPANNPGDTGLRIESGNNSHAGASGGKPPRLEVSVISTEVPRLEPEIATVERVVGSYTFQQRGEAGSGRSSSGETREWGHSGKADNASVLWFAGSGLLVCLIVVAAMMLSPVINRSNAMNTRPGETQLVIAADRREEAMPITDMLSRDKEARLLYQKWLTAGSKDEVSSHIRNPEAVLPQIAEDALPRLSPDKGLPDLGVEWNASEQDGQVFGILEGELRDFTPFTAYFVLVDGALRLDWEASTGHGSADFESLARRQGDTSEIRGWLKPSDFYTLVFPEDRFQSYQFFSPDFNSSVWVYTRKGDTSHEKIRILHGGGEIVGGSDQPRKLTLRLEAGPEESAPNHWVVAELLHNEWIEP